MNRKWFPFLLVILLAVAVWAVKSLKKKESTDPGKPNTTKARDTASVNRNRGFDRHISLLEYSKHAKCRMECRTVTQAEVELIMKEGSINYRKSDLKNARCPRYALEGNTNDGQKLRIVFAQCNETTAVVTVIDLETEFACNCPGDDKKYKNK